MKWAPLLFGILLGCQTVVKETIKKRTPIPEAYCQVGKPYWIELVKIKKQIKVYSLGANHTHTIRSGSYLMWQCPQEGPYDSTHYLRIENY